MMDPNEPSIHHCGAPWNEDDEGNCACSGCVRRRHKQAYEELMEGYDERSKSVNPGGLRRNT